MSASDIAINRLKIEEGFRGQMYLDSVGRRTIGYGANLDAGLTEHAAASLLSAQVQDCANSLSVYWWASGLDDARMSVLIDMAFNIGLTGLLHFVNMLSCVGKKDWPGAQAALLDSAAAREIPGRYQRLGQILLTGAA